MIDIPDGSGSRPTLRPGRIGASRAAPRGAGVTLPEVMAVLAIGAVLLAILLPVMSRARATARNAACALNLRQMAVALHLYAGDNGTCLPDPARANQSWEQMIRRYYQGGTFVCPADNELARAVGSSYDWRDTGHATTTLAGRCMPDVRRQNAVMIFEAMPGWHYRRRLNVARVDCSVTTMLDDQCLIDLSQPIVTTDRGP